MRRTLPLLALLLVACADGSAPELQGVTMLPDTHDTLGPYRVDALSWDDRGLDQVQLLWCVRDTELGDSVNRCEVQLDAGYATVVMENLGSDHFRGQIPGQWHGRTVHYYVLAIDDSGNQTAVPDGAPRRDGIIFSILEVEK